MNNQNEDVHEPSSGRVERRTLLVGAAWAAPVVVGLSAIPAIAASTPPAGKAQISFNTPGVDFAWDGSGHRVGLKFRIQIENNYQKVSEVVTSLTVKISVPDTYFSASSSATLSTATQPAQGASGTWALYGTPVAAGNGMIVFTLTFTGTIPYDPSGNTGEVNLALTATTYLQSPIPTTIIATSPQAANSPITATVTA